MEELVKLFVALPQFLMDALYALLWLGVILVAGICAIMMAANDPPPIAVVQFAMVLACMLGMWRELRLIRLRA